MSNIIARVSKIQNCDNLHLVEFNFNNQSLSMVSLELNKKIKIGTQVKLVIKPSHITIAKNFTGDISYSNKLDSTIVSIENGKLLSSVKLDFFDSTLESIITHTASQKMNLQVGDKVIAFIKESELSISEIIDA